MGAPERVEGTRAGRASLGGVGAGVQGRGLGEGSEGEGSGGHLC